MVSKYAIKNLEILLKDAELNTHQLMDALVQKSFYRAPSMYQLGNILARYPQFTEVGFQNVNVLGNRYPIKVWSLTKSTHTTAALAAQLPSANVGGHTVEVIQ